VHTFRPLSGDELGNAEYQSKNPKQKNFLGELQGTDGGHVLLTVNLTGSLDRGDAKKGPKRGAPSKAAPTNSAAGPKVRIPLPLIAKANLEPDFDLDGDSRIGRQGESPLPTIYKESE
jgi:hypothetical protein